ncbi:MAG: type II toxin-antitoxin system RelE/ParE family toxin [Syntrophales bacterium]|nr:type II toxin-antitoxin system RelE/ParE family toxin [Syntrophales bacterium]
MARKVIWSYEATDDLDALAEYIARDSSFYAAAFTQQILDTSRSLNEFSERGRIVPELGNPNIRELLIRDYRLIYTV